MRYPKTFFVLFFVLFALVFLCLSGKMLDKEAERVVSQLYPRDKNGIVEGLQPITKTQGYPNALILFHVFQSNPTAWSDLIHDIEGRVHADIYAPLLPFHGKNLETLVDLDTDVLKKYILSTIKILSQKYKSVTVVGFSLSGALLADLAAHKDLPKNVNIILYNPAIYLKANTFSRRTQMHLYSLWRAYCNYPSLGCSSPNYASGDTMARSQIDAQKGLKYNVIPAALQVYELDLQNRDSLSKIDRPYDLIISKDDNYSNTAEQKKVCEADPKCHLHFFDSGKHLIHWSTHKGAFEDLMVGLVRQ
jgi:esterase/lipase